MYVLLVPVIPLCAYVYICMMMGLLLNLVIQICSFSNI